MCTGYMWRMKVFFVIILEILQSLQYTTASTPKQLNATFHTKEFKSGPIFLLDKHTIFISLFKYSHNGINNFIKQSKWFKAKATNHNHEDTLLDLYFPNAESNLEKAELSRDYHRENVYLQMNESLDITHIHSLVIVNDNDRIFATLDFHYDKDYELNDSIGNPLIKDNHYIFRYPKCCPEGKYQSYNDCVAISNEKKTRVPVHLINGLDFNNDPMQNIIYSPYHFEPPCDNMYFLDDTDEYYMLINGQLLYGIQDFACMDFIEAENNTLMEVIFMCSTTNTEIISSLNNIYVSLMYISSAALFIWALALTIVLVKKKVSVKTLMGISTIYSVLYAIHFIILATARTLGVESDMCKIMGYLYQFFLLSSFVSLFALVYEGFYRVRHYSEDHSRSRMLLYFGFCAVPIITTIVSIATNELTLSETSRKDRDNACWFRSERKVYYYYVPILLTIGSCMIIQIMTYFDIKKANRKRQEYWLIEATKYRNMFRLGAYMNGIMTVCWLMEVLAYCFEAPNVFWFIVDGVNSMQGIAIFIAFSYHYSIVWKKLLNCSTKAFTSSTHNHRHEGVPLRHS